MSLALPHQSFTCPFLNTHLCIVGMLSELCISNTGTAFDATQLMKLRADPKKLIYGCPDVGQSMEFLLKAWFELPLGRD